MNLREMTYNLLPKRAKAARFAMMPHLTKYEKLAVWKRRWPEQVAGGRERTYHWGWIMYTALPKTKFFRF